MKALETDTLKSARKSYIVTLAIGILFLVGCTVSLEFLQSENLRMTIRLLMGAIGTFTAAAFLYAKYLILARGTSPPPAATERQS